MALPPLERGGFVGYDEGNAMLFKAKIDDYLGKLREEAEEREAERNARAASLPYLNLITAPVQVDALGLIPEERAHRLGVAVFEFKKPNLALAITSPDNPEVKKLIEEFRAQSLHVNVFVGSLRGLNHILGFYKFLPKPAPPITSRINITKERVAELAKELAGIPQASKHVVGFDFENRSVTEFAEIVLAGALANSASDLHFEPEEKAVKLRYRIDGLLHDVTAELDHVPYKSVISRIKLFSNLKLNIQDRPQDGRFTIGFAAKEIEMRVAIAPSEYGEIVVMRILDPDAINITLPQLGLREDDLVIIQEGLNQPNGMILNTGPTGSGKTTTLYAFLRSKLSPEIKIITIEDPIEYHVQGMEQTQVDEEAGYTFANGLRSLMRQDPDVILVGEIRDKETAEIGLQAALTGHLVFSTVHANEAAGAIPRLLDLNAKASSIGPALKLIIGQRLVRRLCANCRVAVPASDDIRAKTRAFLEKLPRRVNRAPYANITVFKASESGCPTCNGFGYKGRTAIYELLSVTKDLGGLIMKEAILTEFMEAAEHQGMVTMQQDGVLKVLGGITSFAEVEETTGTLAF